MKSYKLALAFSLLAIGPLHAEPDVKMTPGALMRILPEAGDIPIGAAVMSGPSGKLAPLFMASKVPAAMMGKVRFQQQAFVKVDKGGKWGFILKIEGVNPAEVRAGSYVTCRASWTINDQPVLSFEDQFGSSNGSLLIPMGSGAAELEPGIYKSQIELACPTLNLSRLGKDISLVIQVIPPGGSQPALPPENMFLRAVN